MLWKFYTYKILIVFNKRENYKIFINMHNRKTRVKSRYIGEYHMFYKINNRFALHQMHVGNCGMDL
jgi:hypothetical protein